MAFDWYTFWSLFAGCAGLAVYAAGLVGWIDAARFDADGCDRGELYDYNTAEVL